jgi:transcription elongation factor GreA
MNRKLSEPIQNTTEKKFYLTQEGFNKTKKDYAALLALRASMLSGDAPAMLHSEELSQEYLSFLEDIDLLNTKIADLKYIIENTQLIKIPKEVREKTITLGAKVVVEDEIDKKEFCIVGTLEADPVSGRISNESPVGQALLGHKIGDLVSILFPVKKTYKIKKIQYSGC